MSEDPKQRFEAIFNAHFDSVLRFALARAQPEVAQDAVAETFTAAWRGLDDLPSEPRPWLLAVARRKLADHYRAAGRREALHTALSTLPAVDATDPAEIVAEHSKVRGAFAVLRPADQEVLRLLAWDGLSRAEAAEVLGCSPALFNVRLHRARKRLREALEDQAVEDHAPDHQATDEHKPGAVTLDDLLAIPEIA